MHQSATIDRPHTGAAPTRPTVRAVFRYEDGEWWATSRQRCPICDGLHLYRPSNGMVRPIVHQCWDEVEVIPAGFEAETRRMLQDRLVAAGLLVRVQGREVA